MTKPKLISQRAYAKHRGVAPSSVRQAIEEGRLSSSLAPNAKGQMQILSCEAADNEWDEKTTQPFVEPREHGDEEGDGDPDFMQFAEAHRRLEVEKWLQAKIKRQSDELDLAKRTGELISVAEARDTVISEYSSLKTKLLGVPIRAAQRIPDLSQESIKIIEDLIREALEALSDGE